MDRRKRRAVFVDRDGVINRGGKVDRVHEFLMLPCVREALEILKSAGFVLILTTNQGGLGEDLEGNVIWDLARLDRGHLSEIHARMQDELGPNACLDAIKFCPHAYWAVDCKCHKPKPGMILEAAEEYDIDLALSFMIGDKAADCLSGIAAGVHPILVLTGEHAAAEQAKLPPGCTVTTDLLTAAALILSYLRAESPMAC